MDVQRYQNAQVGLDPFMGSGQTAIAAKNAHRYYVGYEINEEYIRLAERRIMDFLLEWKSSDLFNFGKK